LFLSIQFNMRGWIKFDIFQIVTVKPVAQMSRHPSGTHNALFFTSNAIADRDSCELIAPRTG
jgi:hypothetical protein